MKNSGWHSSASTGTALAAKSSLSRAATARQRSLLFVFVLFLWLRSAPPVRRSPAGALAPNTYSLSGSVPSTSTSYKYLGLNLSSDLSWSSHINQIVKKANTTLGFVKRNLKLSPSSIKLLAYTSLVLPKIEYASSVWDSHHINLINIFEGAYSRTLSVTAL